MTIQRQMTYFKIFLVSHGTTDFYSLFLCCTVTGQGKDWACANMLNPTTFCMYVPVQSQEPVIQWLSFGCVLHYCFSFVHLCK